MIIYQVSLTSSAATCFHENFASAKAVASAEPHPLQEIQQYEIATDKEAIVRILNGGPYKDWKMQRRWVMTKRGGFQEVALDANPYKDANESADGSRRFHRAVIKAAALLQGSPEVRRSEPHTIPDDGSEISEERMEELMARSSPALRKLTEAEQQADDEWKARHVFKGHDYQTNPKAK